MEWARHSRSWPNAAHSEFVDVPPHRWHIQRAGEGPVVVLLHGAGASTHSWAPIFEKLSQQYDTIALDLPGQGFTKMGGAQSCGLNEMSADIASLLAALEVLPAAIIGHSAGAAIAVELAARLPKPPVILSINGAFDSFTGMAGVLFPAIAKTLALSPMTGALFSLVSDSDFRVRKLIESTGSKLPDDKIAFYRTLIRDSQHVNATLAMMANWSLDGMAQALSTCQSEVHFLVGGRDKAVRPSSSQEAAGRVAGSTIETISSLGHLMHEEDPDTALDWINRSLRKAEQNLHANSSDST